MIDYLRGFATIVGFLLLGVLLHHSGVPIPGGVAGLLIFYLAMSVGLVKLRWVERTASLLLHHMTLLFVPLTVGLMDIGPVLSRQALTIIASLIVSTSAVVLTTGLLGHSAKRSRSACGVWSMSLVQSVAGNPVFSIVFTLVAYWRALALQRRWGWIPPVVTACLPIMVLLVVVREPYAEYSRGGSVLTWLLGPATVALAVPMYRHGMVLRNSLPKLLLVVFAGTIVGMATAGFTAWLLGAPLPVVMSTVPKSVTTPIAIEVCKELKGIPQVTVAMVILAGVLGAGFAVPLLRLAGVRDDRAIGAAMGTSAHGIGTASLMGRSEMQAAVSSWAMAAAGVITSLLASLLTYFLH